MSELVQKLSRGEHPVEVSIRPDRTPEALKSCIDKGYVHLKFTATRGGTDLYVPIVAEETDLTAANFANGEGDLKLVGKLTLDFIPVKCHARIDLKTMAGTGRLEPVTV
jgi:hypothetical protein